MKMKLMMFIWSMVTVVMLSGCTILGFEAKSTKTTNVETEDLSARITALEKRVSALEAKH